MVDESATGELVTFASVDQGQIGAIPQQAAMAQGIAQAVVSLPEVIRGFVLLLPRGP